MLLHNHFSRLIDVGQLVYEYSCLYSCTLFIHILLLRLLLLLFIVGLVYVSTVSWLNNLVTTYSLSLVMGVL